MMSCQKIYFINSKKEYNTELNRLQPRRLALGHNSQQLPLVLKPIRRVSNTHFPFTIVELFYSEGFSEGVGQNFFSINLQKIDVASFHDLSYEVVAPQNVLGAVMSFRLLSLSNGSSAVTVHQNKTI